MSVEAARFREQNQGKGDKALRYLGELIFSLDHPIHADFVLAGRLIHGDAFSRYHVDG